MFIIVNRSFIFNLSFIVIFLIAFSSTYDIRRIRMETPEGWVRGLPANPKLIVDFQIALKQKNIDLLEVRSFFYHFLNDI